MAKQDLTDLGFREGEGVAETSSAQQRSGGGSTEAMEGDGRRRQGFIAGVQRR